MKVRKKGRNRYIKMQEGGFGVFRGTARYREGEENVWDAS